MDKKKCLYCKKSFVVKGKFERGKQQYVRKGSIQFERQKYCNRGCYLKDLERYTTLGKKHPSWKGGKIERDGYIYVHRPDHPFSGKQGYIAEHRIVMEKKIGRYLKPKEVVHHINENRKDNRVKNLELFESAGKHSYLAHHNNFQKK